MKKPGDTAAIQNIIQNYIDNEQDIVKRLYFQCNHGTTIGGFREDIWREMFAQIVPKKFVIEQSVFIMDSNGRISNEVDLAILDETYTPYIFKYGRLKFIPIEAVAVVIECKSTSLDQNALKAWAEAIISLKTSRDSCVRTMSGIVNGADITGKSLAQTATRPIRILCCLNERIVNQQLNDQEVLFDFILRANQEAQELKIEIDGNKTAIKDWYFSLNHANPELREMADKGDKITNIGLSEYEVHCKQGPGENTKLVSLLSFNLQLNQLLMLINNPIWFPHIAYAKKFNDVGTGEI